MYFKRLFLWSWIMCVVFMQRALAGEKDSLSLEQIQKESSDPQYKGPLCPLSPASIEAYQSLGIDPETLRYYPVEYYMRKHSNRADLADIEHSHCESRRKQVFAALIAERDVIRDAHDLKRLENASKGEASRLDEMMNSMAAREEHRMEMAKRQREKELQMMRTMEQLRQQTQEKFNKKLSLLEERQIAKNEERKRMEEARKNHQAQQLREKIKVRHHGRCNHPTNVIYVLICLVER